MNLLEVSCWFTTNLLLLNCGQSQFLFCLQLELLKNLITLTRLMLILLCSLSSLNLLLHQFILNFSLSLS